jgi:outer membrane protein assembly factor BamB|tara:strand:+ start:4972 stop:6138 length:1167 start_codon:yes stop_codon:yes gene_type:complete
MYFSKKLAVLGLLSMLTACSGKVPDWLISDDLVLPPAELIDFEAKFEAEVVWSKDAGEGAKNKYSDLRTLLQNGNVIAIDQNGEVNSYNGLTGQLNWQIELEVPVVAGPGGGEELILVGTQEGEVIALNENSGEFIWRTRLTSEVLTPPKAALGVVIARTADGRMSGISIDDGEVLWNYQRSVPLLSLRGAGAPTIKDDKVIVGYANGKLVALSISDGKLIWEKSVAVSRGRTEIDRLVDIDSELVTKGSTIYAVAYNGNLAALDIETGRVLWKREISSRAGIDVAPNEAVYVSDENSYVWAIQDGSGNGLWRQTELLRRNITAPVIVGDYVIVGDLDGYIHWISREDGSFVSRMRLSTDAIRSKPVIGDGLVYISAIDGTVAAIRIP